MFNWLKQILQDNKGVYSLTNTIAFGVFLIASVTVVKAIYFHELTTAMFGYYLVYGLGHKTAKMLLQVLGAKYGVKFDKDDSDGKQ